jgi:hypothetical protein
MMNIDRLILRINAVLDGQAEGFEARALASEYAALSESVRERMRQCAALIKAGNDNAALQVAEASPPVLDLAAKLAFDRSAEWRDYCKENRIPTPHRVEDRVVDAVNGLYAKEIGESHPLYRDYRAAMRERDDMRAIGVLRSIVRVNAGDKNAREEFERLTAKLRREMLLKLREVQQHHRDNEIFGILSEMEAAGLGPCADKPEWVEAMKVREEWERKRALGEAILLVPRIIALRDANEWEGAIPLLGKARALQNQYGFRWPKAEGDTITHTETWVAGHASVVEKIRKEEEKTEDLYRRLEDLEKHAAGKDRPKAIIEGDIASVNTWLSEAEALPETAHFKVPITRAKHVRSRLNAVLHHRRRRRIIITLASVLTVLALAAVATWQAQKAAGERNFAEKLTQAESTREIRPVMAFLAGPVREHPSLAAAGDRPARIAALRTRADEADRILRQVRDEAQALRTAAGAASADMIQLKERLSTLEPAMNSLAPDVRGEVAPIYDEAAKLIGERSVADPLKKLEALMPPPGATDFSPGEDFSSAIAALGKALTGTVTAADSTVKRARETLAAAEALDSGAGALRDARAKLADAKSLDSLLEALTTLAALQPESPETLAAKRVADAAETLKKLPEALLPAETASMRRAVLASGNGPKFIPAEISATEASAAAALATAARFADLRVATLTNHFTDGGNSSSTVYLKDTPVTETFKLSGGVETRVRATVMKPDGTTTRTTFTSKKFDGRSATGETLDGVVAVKDAEPLASASRAYDSDRGVFTESPLALLDRTIASDASSLSKAWIHQTVLKVTSERPEAWGLAFSPQMTRDAAKLREILSAELTGTEWMRPERSAELRRKLDAFYAEKRAPYLPAAEARRALVKAVLDAGVAYSGRTDLKGAPVPSAKPGAAGDRIFGLDETGQPSVLGVVDASGAIALSHRAAPFSPLLRLAISPSKVAGETATDGDANDVFLPKP